MAIKITEKPGGKRGAGSGKFDREAEYNIIGTRDADEAYDHFFQYIITNAAYRAGLPLETVEIDGDEDQGAAKYFSGTAKYGNRQPEIFDIGIPHYSFSTKGGTAKVLFGKALMGAYGPNPPDFGVGLNYVQYRGFEGAEIIVPKWTKTVKIAYPRLLVNFQFEAMLRRITGTFNSHPFLGMAPGECFFNGAEATEGERRDRNGGNLTLVYDLTFEFLGMPNVQQEVPGIGIIDKRGWDYSWPFSVERPDPLSNRMVTVPKNMYVVQVYDPADFNILGF